MGNLAKLYFAQNKYAQAEALNIQVLEIERRLLGPEHPSTLRTVNNLAGVYYDQGKLAQAEPLLGQSLEIRRRVLGIEHRETLSSMNNLALVYEARGKHGQAEMLHAQALEIQRRVLGAGHPDMVPTMANLALVYESDGKYAQAEAVFSQALAIQRRVLGDEHGDTVHSMYRLAKIYHADGKYAQAEALFVQTVKASRRVFGPENNAYTLDSLGHLAFVCERRGEYEAAVSYATECYTARRNVWGRSIRRPWKQRSPWRWPCDPKANSPRANPSCGRPWRSIGRSSRKTGNDTAPRVCWERAWLDRRDSPKRRRCCSQAIRGWRTRI